MLAVSENTSLCVAHRWMLAAATAAGEQGGLATLVICMETARSFRYASVAAICMREPGSYVGKLPPSRQARYALQRGFCVTPAQLSE